MALVKAVLAGAVAAIAVPYVIRGGSGGFVEMLQYGIVQVSLGSVQFAWSWPLFCVVTLFTWGFLAWAER
jgi:hypothetical protein